MIYTRFYDQVLTEIEAGKVHDGINLLVGMLDTVDLQPGSLAQAGRELRGHSLCQMLLEDPVFAHAQALPDGAADRVRMIGQPSVAEDTSSTGRRLFAVTRELAVARALRDRRESFDLKLFRAWQRGGSICLIDDDSSSSLASLGNSDTSNVVSASFDELSNVLTFALEWQSRFDLILAPDLLDRAFEADLQKTLTLMRACLVENGSIILAGITPQHLGAGWRSACLNWNPDCHDENSLAKLAAEAGLSARTYRDNTDCIIWADLRNASDTSDQGGIYDAR